jgi:hypothetical protein
MYVICAGMYRACSTWQYEVIAQLIEKHRGGIRLGYLTGEKFAAFDEVWADKSGWSVLKSHEGAPRFVSAIAEGRAVAVYTHRDIRDVVFSLMHKRRVAFDTLLRQGMIHQIVANDRFWSTQPGVLSQRYDALIANPELGVEQIATHLGLELAPGEAAAVAKEYSFQANRQRMLSMGHHLRAEGVDLDDPRNVQYYDTRTLLHWNHMRDGRSGNWRELATPRERAILARLCDPWLAAHGYPTDTLDAAATTAVAERVRQESELARAWLACALRCASLRHPRMARTVKRCLRIRSERVMARPIASPAPVLARRDAASLKPAAQPHNTVDAQPRLREVP